MTNSFYIYYYAGSAFFNGLFALFLVYYIYLRNKKNPLNRSFLYFGISVAGWSLLLSFWALAADKKIAEVLLHLHMTFASLIPATFFHFVTQYTKIYEKQKRMVILGYVLGVFYSICCLSNQLMISGVKKAMYFDYWPKPGLLLPSHVVYFSVAVTVGIFLLLRKALFAKGTERRLALFVSTAFVIGFGGGATNWFLWFDVPIPPFMNFFVGIMFAMLAYAIVRHGLMDIDLLIEIVRNNRLNVLGLLASSIRHEIRNPLFIAKGMIETHQDHLQTTPRLGAEEQLKESEHVLGKVLAQLNRLTDVIQKISTLTQTNVETKKTVVNLQDALNNVLELVAHELESKKINVKSEGLECSVNASLIEIEEILLNLIINACDAMPNGGELMIAENVTVPGTKKSVIPAIFQRESTNHGSPIRDFGDDKVTLTITDTGTGISREHIKHIFEPFHTTKGEKGTGLGLYITKQIIERSGGKISVESKEGKGTTFKLEFQKA